MKYNTNDILVISNYDSACWFSIMIDGYIIDRDELDDNGYAHKRFPKGLRNKAKLILRHYTFDKVDDFKKYVLENYFQYKQIIFCEDGNIEVWKDK